MPTTITSDWHYTNRLAVHPTSATTLIAATTTGIWKTTDAGATDWDQALPGHNVFDVDFDPTNGSKAVAGGYGGGAWYSTTGGDLWLAATGLPLGGRIELAYAASDPTIVFASVNDNGGVVYKSTDGGHSYTIAGAATGLLGSQGDYGNAIWVSPSNPLRLIVGGIDLYQSTDGGQTFTKISRWQTNQTFVQTGTGPDSAHADHHAIVADADFRPKRPSTSAMTAALRKRP